MSHGVIRQEKYFDLEFEETKKVWQSFTCKQRTNYSIPIFFLKPLVTCDQSMWHGTGPNALWRLDESIEMVQYTMDEEIADFSETAFEEMLVSLRSSPNITFIRYSLGWTRTEGDKHSAMYSESVSDDPKKYLLRQNRQFKSNQQPTGDRPFAPHVALQVQRLYCPNLYLNRLEMKVWCGEYLSLQRVLEAPRVPTWMAYQIRRDHYRLYLVNKSPEDIQPFDHKPKAVRGEIGGYLLGGEKNIPFERGGLNSVKSAKW